MVTKGQVLGLVKEMFLVTLLYFIMGTIIDALNVTSNNFLQNPTVISLISVYYVVRIAVFLLQNFMGKKSII